jgi:hypothetical protein
MYTLISTDYKVFCREYTVRETPAEVIIYKTPKGNPEKVLTCTTGKLHPKKTEKGKETVHARREN